VLDGDPYQVEPDQISAIQVLQTWVDGDRIHLSDRALVSTTS
jgi:predicted amidohydrolase YtcJ